MGMDGSSGNSETFNIRLGATAARKTTRHSFLFDLDYHKNTNEAVETANRLYSEGRYERLSETKPWTWFFKQTTEYDEFQPWDVRIVSTSGFGYRFLDGDITTLTARLGAGFSQQVGGFDQDIIPEMNYGFEYSHRMTKRQKIALSVEYFPNLVNYSEFRMVSKGDWEVLLDAENNLSLKISVNDRYAYPNLGGELNDLDYALVLLWSF
jgi:putative salt-induced outer membrane protein YdiY